jgi:hypothetical protein
VTADPASGKPSIEDVLQEPAVPAFPKVYPRIVTWVELVDGRGSMSVELTAVRPADRLAGRLRLGHVRARVDFTRPGQFRTVLLVLDDLPLIGPGSILFRVECGGVAIMECELMVLAVPPGAN